MRLLLIGLSSVALGACSFNGGHYGYGGGHDGYNPGHAGVSHGVWQGAGYGQAGYGLQGCSINPCVAPQAPAMSYQAQYAAYGQAMPTTYLPQPVTPPPTIPAPTYPAQPCAPSPCSGGTYAVSPTVMQGPTVTQGYGFNTAFAAQPSGYAAQTPGYHAYGTHTSGYGHAPQWGGVSSPGNQDYVYGTLGAVWYDLDKPYAGLQGRLGYQSANVWGAEVEGSIGVINEVSPFNQDVGGGTTLTGEFKDGIDYSVAAFATARFPLTPLTSVHGRFGLHKTEGYSDVSFDNYPDQETSVSQKGVAYGAGIEFSVSPVEAIRADYTRYEGDGDANDSLSLAYLRRF